MTPQPPPGRRRLPRGFIAIVLAAVLAVVGQFVILYALGLFGSPSPSSDDTSRLSVRDEAVAFAVDVPAGTAISTVDVREREDCEYKVYDANGSGLVFEAVPRDCEREYRNVSNGDHGTYRTIDDVPEPKDVEDVKTHLGPVKVFTQTYDEYTNVHSSYEEPVAIVTFDEPVDPDYPTLVVRSDKGEMSRDAFTQLVTSLIEPR